jgi:hypothetical protein
MDQSFGLTVAGFYKADLEMNQNPHRTPKVDSSKQYIQGETKMPGPLDSLDLMSQPFTLFS